MRLLCWGGTSGAVTEGLDAFQADVYRFQGEYGFLSFPDGKEDYAFTWNQDADTKEARAAMEDILRRHGLQDSTLESHYGTRVWWKIFGHASGHRTTWVRDSDWHCPLPAAKEEQHDLEQHREEVLADSKP